MATTTITVPEVEVATSADTRADVLGSQTRDGAPIRSAFLQERGGDRAPGPLHRFVRERQYFALQLYLLLHCVARGDPWDAWLPAGAWARMLDKTSPTSAAGVSRAWRWLKREQLIRSEREKRILRVWLLREDGSGDAYERSRDYFTLPLAYFLKEWHTKLSLPGTVALLIALDKSRSSEPWFQLRKEHAAGWFNISADTLQRGLDELQKHGQLVVRQRPIKAPRSPKGWVMVNEYRLIGDFGRKQTLDQAFAEVQKEVA
jgi:hypothetical protein